MALALSVPSWKALPWALKPTQSVAWQRRARRARQVHNPFIGQFVPRNSPTILNSALLGAQFWDGRVEGYSPAAAIDQAAAQTVAVKTQERVVNDMALTDPLATQALFPVASLHEMAGATFGGLPAQTIRTHLLERLRAHPRVCQPLSQRLWQRS